MTKKPRTLIMATLLISSSALSLSGQPGQQPGWSSEARIGGGYYGGGNLRDSSAEVDGPFAMAEVDLGYTYENGLRFSVSLGAGIWDADWSGPVNNGAAIGDPFDRAEQLDLSGNVYYRIDQRLAWIGFAAANWARTDGAPGLSSPSLSDGDTYTFGSALIYQLRPNLSISGGLLYRTGLEDDDLLIPVLGLRYRHDDNWSVRVLDTSAISDFDIIGIDYTPTIQTNFVYSASLQWASNEYLMGSFTDGSGRRIAYQDEAFRLLLGASWSPNSSWFIQPYAGYDIHRKIKFISDDTSLASYKVRDSWVVGINIGARF